MEHINLELVPCGIERTAHASQYDHGRQIRFDIYNGGTPYTLSGAETITMQVNGQSEAVPNTSDDYIIWTVPDELCETDGVTECELRIVESGVLIGSKNFFLEVEYDPYGTGVLILSVHGSPAHFNTDLADNAVECKVDIAYNANGYKSALLVNTSNAPSEDSTPYLCRPSFANGYGYETLIGGTCGVNQLVQNGNFADTSVWTSTNASLTVASNIGTVALSGNWGRISQNLNGDRRLNGKYLINCAIKANSSGDIGKKVRIGLAKSDTSDFDYRSYDLTDSWITVNYLINSSYATANYLMFTGNNNICTFDLKNVNVIDLTQMFGTSIADYVYTLESGTSGAGVTWLKNNGFFNEAYYPYNAGDLLSVKTSKKINTGKNFVALNTSPYQTAVNTGVSVNSESTDLLSITASAVAYACRQLYYKLPAGTYTVSLGETTKTGTETPVVSIYDYPNGTLIVNALSANNNVVFTLSDETVLDIRLFATGNTAEVNTVTFSDFQIELGSTATAYEPYVLHEYPLDDIELRGILKLDGNNNLYYDGDTYESNGSVTRNYGIVTLDGSNDEDWGFVSGNHRAYISVADIDTSTADNAVMNIISSDYIAGAYSGSGDRITGRYGIAQINVFDDSVADISAWRTKLTNNPLVVVYELATPTTETADAFTNPMVVDGNGTEEFVDGRTVEMPVGHSTIYGEDMKARFTDFGVTVYGGEYNLTTGVLTSTKNADGTDKNPPDVYDLTPASMPVRNGENYVLGNTNGDAYVKYYKKA